MQHENNAISAEAIAISNEATGQRRELIERARADAKWHRLMEAKPRRKPTAKRVLSNTAVSQPGQPLTNQRRTPSRTENPVGAASEGERQSSAALGRITRRVERR